MHIGLNLVFLVPGETGGMEIAAGELIPALLEQAPPQMRFTAFVSREGAAGAAPWRGLMPVVEVPVNSRNRLQWVLGEQTLLPPAAMRRRVQLVHSLASTGPAWGAFRRVVTVHDLIYARFPETHAGIRDLGMRVLVPLAVRRSDRVIAISQSTCDDLVELCRTPPEKISVVPQGLGTVVRAAPLSERQTRERLQLGSRRVVLSLSAKRPHKNLRALLDALAELDAAERPVLVLPGYPTEHERELREHAQRLGVDADVRFLGWVSGEELEGLWALACAFVFPSLYEGFGLPVLEAMARGVPVACSSTSSLPEVAGDAALLFDPSSTSEIASALRRLLADEQLRERLRERGVQRARSFTWARTARLTLDAYARALGSSLAGGASPAAGSADS